MAYINIVTQYCKIKIGWGHKIDGNFGIGLKATCRHCSKLTCQEKHTVDTHETTTASYLT